MARQQRIERAAMGSDPYKTAIIKLMRQLFVSHDPHTVFSDFVEVSAIAISSRVDMAQFDVREKRYLEIVARYTREDLDRFAGMFGQLHLCYQSRVDELGEPGTADIPGHGLGDVLGEIFMALELGNARNGQFFTPYSVSMLMAMIAVGDGASVREQGFATLQEPACGSGGMVVATAQAMHHAGLSYPETLHATCVDIDRRCVHMAYVQLSLLGIPAVVVHGNALSLEVKEVWYTPAHAIVGWQGRLVRRLAAKAMLGLMRGEDPATEPGCVEDPSEAPGTADVPIATTRDLQREAVSAGAESELAVAECHDPAVSPSVPGDSVATLFEQVISTRDLVPAQETIFDRIAQLVLF
ncbi:SAM-dependent methyltransferase (plasmid) [Paraburkholderia sp. D15]|uniref:N-6 DNA methylase n=1 Tax=Paraburkholderia sp. D15 TaxID=2880218 RepID=UPI002478C516|nr:N-6 DNA methylase [Paraburkholderia sp. D15]WGS55060.1 SAM-dependent methyltransferase [Paraburkholderia sp. D15]